MMDKEQRTVEFQRAAEDFNKQNPVVRYAVPEDYPQIIALGEELHAENGHSDIDYDVAEAAIMEAINRKHAMIGVIGDVGKIEGIIFLRFASFWNSRDVFLEELFLYVPPEFRKTGNAKALLLFAKDVAERLELPLMIGVLSNHRTRAKLRLYEKHLGAPVGGYFFIGGAKEKMRL